MEIINKFIEHVSWDELVKYLISSRHELEKIDYHMPKYILIRSKEEKMVLDKLIRENLGYDFSSLNDSELFGYKIIDLSDGAIVSLLGLAKEQLQK